MRLNKQLQFAVHFERFSREMEIPAPYLAQMIAEADASKRCYERDDTKGEQKHGGNVERIAAEYGCAVDWPGLWPCIQRKGKPNTNQLLPA